MRPSNRITVLTATLLIWVPTTASSDVSAALEKSALQRYTVTQGERTLTRGCTKLKCTFSKLGTRWTFLNRYDTYNSRTWKSPPLQINGCEEGYIIERENGTPSLILSYCNNDQENIFSILNNRAVISLHSPSTANSIKQDNPIEIAIRTNNPELDAHALKTETIQNWPEILPTKTLDQIKQATTPPNFKFIQVLPPTLKEFEEAHAIAEKIWRDKPQNNKKPEEKAQNIIKSLEPMLLKLDWRDLPDSEMARLNDIGFWLQQTNQCNDAIDAAAILQDVVRRAPERTSALLNLAEAQARTLEDECKINTPFFITKLAMQKNLRAYCKSYGAERIPIKISSRIQKLLDVDALNEETCRSRDEIFEAIKIEDIELLTKTLDEHPEDIEEPSPLHQGTLPLFVAVSQRWLPGVEVLLQAGAAPDRARPSDRARIYDTTPLQRSVYDGSTEIVKALLKHNASPDQYYNNSKPLVAAAALRGTHQALAQPSIEILQMLIDSGANINQRDSNGTTALMAAVKDGNLANVDFLLEHGADANILDNAGRNALSQARLLGTDHDLIWSHIIQNGGNINQQDRYGKSPLFHILSWRSGSPATISSMVKFALEHHADPNLRDFEEKQVALHLAAKDGNLSVVNALIQAGANRCPLDRSGRVPGDLAAKSLNNLISKPECKESSYCSDIAVFHEIVRLLDCKSLK
ncbi:ankyrin repeat domain-containing protein [Pseudomonas sp. BGr12]|uniref:ankyrin repeat domain-containing protein n=1 Tax=Pseudomonas sp. BGr12 TaxID=2936269 RepID=UPI00255A02BB|nr:ankyrin repeat domain-containing protein [Pseudomonas sp. BJa5]MDL2425794.1 ankyrin repeat domain-containing protein [Pseudomonas sp. BJa5]